MNRIAVVVPAHDEEELLPTCLAALAVAAAAVPAPVEVIVVADACADATATIAADAGAEVVTLTARNVGRARHAGMRHALRRGADGLWLATTDADSTVPPAWLAWHLAHARAGAGLVAGTVLVDDWAGRPPGLPARYETAYRRLLTGTGHEHVHGANLGCAAETYLATGGFPPLTHDEDRALIRRAADLGVPVVADSRCPVRTSSRAAGRAPHGFAAALTALS